MVLAAPLFLFGLLAIGIPVAIHLLQLRKYRKVYFSNVDALQAIASESRQQNRLRNWLILCARVMAIVFLVLAFCQPVVPSRTDRNTAGGCAVSVYIDNSYSMDCTGKDGSLLEEARAKAREIAAAYKADDQFQLITNDAEGAQYRWLSREEFLTNLDQVNTSPVTRQLAHMAKRQADFLQSSRKANLHAYLISDFQESTSALDQYPETDNIHTTFIPLAGSETANIYIDTLQFNSPAFFNGSHVVAQATVRNDGSKAVESVPVRLYVGEQQKAVATADIAAHSSATVDLRFSIDQDGPVFGHVETTDYPVTFDDKLYFSLDITSALPVLSIGGHAENDCLKRIFGQDSLTRYRYATESAIDFTAFHAQALVIADELKAISSGLAHTLQEYVEQGGSLLVIPAEQADLQSYNALLSNMRVPTLGAWKTGKVRASAFNSNGSLYRNVFSGKTEEMEMPTIVARYPIQPTAASVREGIIGLADGSDYLCVSQYGQGRVYLMASPLRSECTDFVNQAMVVPTLYNMALYSRTPQTPYTLLAGDAPIPLSAAPANGSIIHLRNTEGTFDIIPDLRRTGMKSCLIPHGEAKTAGNYLITDNDSLLSGLSFNYSRKESRLTFLSREDIEKALSEQHLANSDIVRNPQKSITDYITQRDNGTPLWQWCILLSLLMLAIEEALVSVHKKRNKA